MSVVGNVASPGTWSQRFAQFVARFPDAQIPDGVLADALDRTLDTIGVALAALALEGSAIPIAFADQLSGRPESSLIGSRNRTAATVAAFANGSLAHWPDFDDTHSNSMLHPSSVVVPTALAVGESIGSTGERCLGAMVIGAEVGLRVATGARHRFQARGYHATGVCGPFAAAAVAARLLGLSPEATTSALGIAGCLSAGLLQGHADGSWAKRFYSGWAAQTGITAALLAREGAIGSPEILEGDAGFYRVLLGEVAQSITVDDLVRDLGARWSLPETTFKLYPSAAWTHSSIDAVLAIMAAEHLTHVDVERIECCVPPAAMPLVCEPREAKVRPKTAYHMKLSLPFTVAMAGVLGRLDVSDFTAARLDDPRIRDLAERVVCTAEPALPAWAFPAIVRLTTRDGHVHAREVLAQRGGPGHPVSRAEVTAKFRRNAAGRLGAHRAAELERAILQLRTTADVGAVMRETGS